MKNNFLHMVCGCLLLLMFTIASCATKPEEVEMEAPEYGEVMDEAGGTPGDRQALNKQKKGEIPNVSVNVLQVNSDEDKQATDGEAGETAGEEAGKAGDRKETEGEDVRLSKIQRIPTEYNVYQYLPDTSKSLGTETLLSEMSKEIAGKVYYELKEEGEKNFTARVAVVNAVPLSDLKRESEFGRIMGEYLLTDLADRGLKVTELRMGKEINILPQTGEFIMTRNIGELANNAPELDYVVITTFSNTRKTLIVQGRLVNLQDGVVKSSWRYGLPLNRELLGLFHTAEAPFKIAVRGIGR